MAAWRFRVIAAATAAVAIAVVVSTSTAVSVSPDAAVVEQATGVKPTSHENGVLRVSWPRGDVAVTVSGAPYLPAGGLTSWAGFEGTPHGVMMMGDTIVFEDEIAPAMDAAFANGLEVTALHNHFLFESPKVYFMHIGGRGDASKLGAAVKAVWDSIKAVRAETAAPATMLSGEVRKAGSMDAEALTKILGAKAAVHSSGAVRFGWGRDTEMHGVKANAAMGVETWASFIGGDERASVAGDFAMTAAEMQTVLKSLRAGGMNIAAIHNHMIEGTPAYFFVHFWASGKPADMAAALRATLDAQAKIPAN
jgi:Domain of Unknown Function (DUF1259)